MTLIYIIAGEQSGDVLGARLIRALQDLDPSLHFAGVGGPRMAEAGFATLFPMQELAVMGLVEVLPRLRRLRRLMQETVADIRTRQPDVLVTIDSPGFNLRVLRQVAGVKRVHYVAPQVWAWRPKRVSEFHGLSAEAPVLVLMPGSRRSEVPRLLPVFRETIRLLAVQIPGLVPVIPVASAVSETVLRATAGWPVRPIIVTDIADKHDAYAAAAAALTKSGTSTLELALAGVPMAVTYRVNPLTAMMARRMIQVPHVAMVNLLAGRRLVPELLQQDCRPDRLAETVLKLLHDPDAAATQRAGIRAVIESLRAPLGKPSAAAATEVLGLISW